MIAEKYHKLLQKLAQKDQTPTSGLISVAIETDEYRFYNILPKIRNQKYFYSAKPAENIKFLGFDSVFDIREQGPNRLIETARRTAELQKNWTNNFEELDLRSVPLVLGGMKFSSGEKETIWQDFADSDWFIPKILFLNQRNKFYVILNYFAENFTNEYLQSVLLQADDLLTIETNSTPSCDNEILESNLFDEAEKQNWIDRVNEALDQITGKEFQKIVLSRQVEIKLADDFDLVDTLSQLENNYPKCYVFAYGQKDSVFFGASPETLAKIHDGWVEADALAGSIRRGKDEEEDAVLADELLGSSKNLAEQKAVVDFISNSFSQFSDEIIFDKQPIIRKLPNIQHLWTPIRAKLKNGSSIFSILKDIHPTPAICGEPWTNALVSIKKMENHSRGMFAGMIGWFNFDNEGEFAVAIRSALASGKLIYAFAGCGIVNGSDPELEFVEAELKLKPILSLFKNEKIYQP